MQSSPETTEDKIPFAVYDKHNGIGMPTLLATFQEKDDAHLYVEHKHQYYKGLDLYIEEMEFAPLLFDTRKGGTQADLVFNEKSRSGYWIRYSDGKVLHVPKPGIGVGAGYLMIELYNESGDPAEIELLHHVEIPFSVMPNHTQALEFDPATLAHLVSELPEKVKEDLIRTYNKCQDAYFLRAIADNVDGFENPDTEQCPVGNLASYIVELIAQSLPKQ